MVSTDKPHQYRRLPPLEQFARQTKAPPPAPPKPAPEPKVAISDEDLKIVAAAVEAQIRSEVEEEVRKEVESQMEERYRKKPVYRGILGLFSRLLGLVPDSAGRPSGSWTLFLLSFLPVILISGSVSWSILLGKGVPKTLTLIPSGLFIAAMVIAGIVYLIHHDKLIPAFLKVSAGVSAIASSVKGGAGGTMASKALDAASGVLNKKEDPKAPPDSNLKPGQKVSVPKVDPKAKKPDFSNLPD